MKRNKERMPENAADDTSRHELLMYRVEEKTRERLVAWAKSQFIAVALALNAIVFLGFGATFYTLLNSAVTKQVEDTVGKVMEGPKRDIEVGIKRYDHLIESEFTKLDEYKKKSEEVRVEMKVAANDANESVEKAKQAISTINSAVETEKAHLKKEIDDTANEIETLKVGLQQAFIDHKQLQDNYSVFGKDIYVRSGLSMEKMSFYVARINALEKAFALISNKGIGFQNIGTNSDYSDILKGIWQEEQDQVQDNQNTLVFIEVQSGANLSRQSEKLNLDLQLRGFKTLLWYTNKDNYEASKTIIRQDIIGSDGTVATNDTCMMFIGELEKSVKLAGEIAQQDGMVKDCAISRNINLAANIMLEVNSSNLKFQRLVVFYRLEPQKPIQIKG